MGVRGGGTRLPIEDRYNSKITFRGPRECWPWTGAHDKKGYGIFWGGEYYPNGRGIYVRATRWRWTQLHGPIESPKLFVCHNCDWPPCMNPEHWFLGDHAANMADMKQKGRGTGPGRGEANHSSRLTAEQVIEMRDRYSAGDVSLAWLGVEYGVSWSTVGKIVRREKWAWLK